MSKLVTAVLLAVIVVFVSCDQSKSAGPLPAKKEGETLLAEVYGRYLYQSDLSKIVSPSASPEDSAAIANAYVEQWIREKLIVQKAEDQISPDLNIDELVDNYRSSLLRLNFERELVENGLDSTITDEEKMAFYNENKSQYLLKQPLLRSMVVRMKENDNRLNDVYNAWVNSDYTSIDKLTLNGMVKSLDDKKWFTRAEFQTYVPTNVLSSRDIRTKRDTTPIKGNDAYFVKILEYRDKNDVAPLVYIEDQINKVILHKRKQSIIKDYTENLYEEETRKNNIKVYPKS